MPIAEALTSITAMIGLVKTLKDIDHDLDKGELKTRMAELYGDLAGVKMELVDAQQDIHSKDQTIKALNERFDFRNSLIEIEGFKYDVVEGNPTGFPYCPTCEINEGKFFRLGRRTSPRHSTCANCKTVHNAGKDGLVNQEPPKRDLSGYGRHLG